MNKFLKKEYDKTEKDLTINNIFREMYGLDLIRDFENWADYREKRNFILYEYVEKYTNSIIDIIPAFIGDVEYLINHFDGVLKD